jgi:molybdopterin-guanine dinucleotide biosynthesis protein B
MRVIGIAGWSGSGKTTLLTRLIPALTARGRSVSTVKHAHHAFDVDQPGKDSHTHRSAGATEVLIASGRRWALMHELRGAPEPDLASLLRHLSPVDLVLVEGFKREAHAKIEVHRAANGTEPLFRTDLTVMALVTDQHFPDSALARAGLDDIEAAADLVERFAEPLPRTLERLAAGRDARAAETRAAETRAAE